MWKEQIIHKNKITYAIYNNVNSDETFWTDICLDIVL